MHVASIPELHHHPNGPPSGAQDRGHRHEPTLQSSRKGRSVTKWVLRRSSMLLPRTLLSQSDIPVTAVPAMEDTTGSGHTASLFGDAQQRVSFPVNTAVPVQTRRPKLVKMQRPIDNNVKRICRTADISVMTAAWAALSSKRDSAGASSGWWPIYITTQHEFCYERSTASAVAPGVRLWTRTNLLRRLVKHLTLRRERI